jgi:hypothetical protein
MMNMNAQAKSPQSRRRSRPQSSNSNSRNSRNSRKTTDNSYSNKIIELEKRVAALESGKSDSYDDADFNGLELFSNAGKTSDVFKHPTDDTKIVKIVSSKDAELNKTMSEIGIGPSVSLKKQSDGNIAVIMDKLAGETLESTDSKGTSLWERLENKTRSRIVKQMQTIFVKAAAKGWELMDNNAGNFIWDGKKLTRIDFDHVHVKRRRNGTTPEDSVQRMMDETANMFDLQEYDDALWKHLP